MRCIISEDNGYGQDLKSYLGSTLNIQQWFCEQEHIQKVNEVKLINVSEKAMQFIIGKKAYWIPKSLLTITKRKEKRLGVF
jgi:hypothetical protein